MQTVRRALGAVFTALLVAVGLVGVGVAAAAPASAATHSSTYCADGQTVDCIQAPRSLVEGQQHAGETATTYCVKNYHGRSVVKIVNQTTGKVGYIHTGRTGAGCTRMPVTTTCQNLAASGPNQDGGPGHSSARLCVSDTSQQTGSHSPGGIFSGGLPFTGSNIIIPGTILGLVLIAVGFFAVLLGRRKRDDDADQAAA